jgi:hypothetical protein
MSFWSRILGGKGRSPAPVEPVEPVGPDLPEAVVVLRRGMNLPAPEYIEGVLERACPGLPASVARRGLSQPSWYKNEEGADSIAQGVVESFAAELGIANASSRRRLVDGPDGCACMIVELRRS